MEITLTEIMIITGVEKTFFVANFDVESFGGVSKCFI
jgi:hypothetical protein